MKRNRLLTFTAAGLLILSLILSGCGGGKKIEVIKLGSHQWNEPAILMEMARLLIEQELPGQKVEHVKNIASTDLLQASMESGDMHVYPSWTGTQWTGPMRQEVTDELRKDPRKIYEAVRDEMKKKGAVVPEPLGFENTYAFVVRRADAEKNGWKTVSDLAGNAPNMVAGVDNNFLVREGDGYEDFKSWYGFQFKDAISMDVGLMYRAVGGGEADTAIAYSTDGRILQLDLVVLKDDKHFFPAYDTILVISQSLLDAYPKLEGVLGQLSGKISVEEMIEMNYKADVEGQDITQIAKEFLTKEGLLK